MEKINYTVLLSAFLVLIFASSCEQKITEPTFTYEVMEYHGKDYLDHYTTPDILFHYAYVDTKNDEYIGWLVDNLGNLKTYNFDKRLIDYLDPQVSAAELGNLAQKATHTGKVVDLDELVENYKRIRLAVESELEAQPVDPNVTGNTYVYGYDLVVEGRSNATANSCGVGASAVSSGDFEQVLLMSKGQFPSVNTNYWTETILEWLEDVANS